MFVGVRPEKLREDLLELALIDLAGAVQVNQKRHRIGNADRIRNLDGAAVGETGGNDVLGEVTRGVGSRAVNLRRILAGERAAAVRAHNRRRCRQ